MILSRGRLVLTASLLASACVPPVAVPTAAPAPRSYQLAVTGAGQALERVTSDPLNELRPAVSPDGSTLLFDANDGVKETTDGAIVGVDASTGARRTLYTASSSIAGEPAWLPDGSSFVYSSNTTGKYSLVRALSSAPNAAITVLVNGEMAPAASNPSVSPDGKRIAFSTNIRDTWTIAVTDIDGSHFTLLGEGIWPRWSPDGQRLVFRRTVNKRSQLFSVDAASGTGLVQLTQGEASFDDPSFSPDGRFVVFSSNLGAKNKGENAWNLYLVRTDGTGLTQLTDGDSLSQQPHWGNDGFIYFSSNQAGNFDIWRLKPVGEFAASASASL